MGSNPYIKLPSYFYAPTFSQDVYVYHSYKKSVKIEEVLVETQAHGNKNSLFRNIYSYGVYVNLKSYIELNWF